MLGRIFTPWRVRWYSRGALAALAAVFALALLSGDGATTMFGGRLGGDYPAFYAAGQIVAEGEAAHLYALETQRDYQKPLIGGQSGVLPFAYPPPLALLYAPLSQLPFRLSYAVHTLALVAALAGACALIARIYPQLVRHPFLLFFLALTAYPILRAVMGAQNTAFSLLLLALIWSRLLANRHYQAGIFLGLLFFKPQFALPLAGLFVLSGRWRVWLSAGVTALAIYGASTALIGTGWIGDWLALVETFARLDVAVNFADLVSWQGFVQALFGHTDTTAAALGWGLAGATALALAWLWFAGGRRGDISAQMALASVGLPLISPHTLYYDAGLALIAVVVLLGRAGAPQPAWILAAWAAGLLQLLSPLLGVSLAFPSLATIAAVAAIALWRHGIDKAAARAA